MYDMIRNKPEADKSDNPQSKDGRILSPETLDALKELGVIFQEIHDTMRANGYTVSDGNIIKIKESENNHRPIGKETLPGTFER